MAILLCLLTLSDCDFNDVNEKPRFTITNISCLDRIKLIGFVLLCRNHGHGNLLFCTFSLLTDFLLYYPPFSFNIHNLKRKTKIVLNILHLST